MHVEFPQGSIRDWRSRDSEPLARLADNANVARHLRDRFPHPYTRRHAEEWIRQSFLDEPKCSFALTVAGALAGGIGLVLNEDVHRASAEIGYWLGEPYWGRGIMTEAVTIFTDYAFGAYVLVRLYALVLEHNLASARVLEKAGYVFEGRLRKSAIRNGRAWDELLFAKINESHKVQEGRKDQDGSRIRDSG